MKIGKRALVIVGSLLVVGTFTACSMDGDTVIEIGKEKISQEELYHELLGNAGKDMIYPYIKKVMLLENVSVKKDEVADMLAVMKKEASAKSTAELSLAMNLSEKQVEEQAKISVAEMKLLKREAKLTEKDIKTYYDSFKNQVVFDSISFTDKEIAEQVLALTEAGDSLERASQKNSDEYHLNYKWNNTFESDPASLNARDEIASLEVDGVSRLIEGKNGTYTLYEIKEKYEVGYEESEYLMIANLASEKGVSLEALYKDMLKESDIEIKDPKIKQLPSVKSIMEN